MINKKVFSWALYDWANSSFATTVMAGFFPVFLKNYWGAGLPAVETTAKLGTTVSFASLLIAVLSPILGVVADMRGYKKIFCFIFMILGALCCVALGTLGSGQWMEALWLYGLGFMCFTASCVFYDALLPSVAKGLEMDKASSIGYSLGYLGGGVLFLINVIMYQKPEWFGFQDGVQAVKFSFVSVGIWWFLFSMPLFFNVPEGKAQNSQGSYWNLMIQTVSQLQKTILEILKNKNLSMFIIAYWLYIDGVYTVITMAVDFGMGIGLKSQHLISALLITQFVGFPFAWLYGLLTQRWGCRVPIISCLVVYTVTVILATQMSQEWHFYALAAVIGMVQGGVQSLSRSLFGNMIPMDKSGEYFAFFNLIGKFASILGPLIVAGTAYFTGNPRFGMVGLLVLFLSGIFLLLKVVEPKHS